MIELPEDQQAMTPGVSADDLRRYLLLVRAGVGMESSSVEADVSARNFVRFTRASQQYLEITSPGLSDISAFTISFRMRMRSDDATTQMVFRAFTGTTAYLVVARNTANKISVTFGRSDGTGLTPTQNLSISTFTVPTTIGDPATQAAHIVATADRSLNDGAGGFVIFVDGVSETTDDLDPGSGAIWGEEGEIGLSAATTLRIGSGPSPSASALGGELADLILTDAWCSAGQVATFAAGQVPAGHRALLDFARGQRANSDYTSDAAKGWNDGYHAGTWPQWTVANGPLTNAHGWVRFVADDHVYLSRSGALTGQPASLTSFLLAARIRIIPAARQIILRGQDNASQGQVQMNLTLSENNRIAVSGTDVNGNPTFGIGASVGNPNGTILPYYQRLLIVASGNGATGDLQLWHYDYESQTWTQNTATVTTAPTTGMEMSADTWYIGEATTGNYDLGSEVSLVALAMAADSTAYVDLGSATVRSHLLQSVSQWGVGTPIILVGESVAGVYDKASDWNAGTNRGTGGNFTASGTVADV